MSRFLDIAALTDIPRQGARVVKTPAGCIAVFRTADDQVFAVDDRCPHKGGPLSEGIVHGTSVTCPLHAMVFDLASGLSQGVDEGVVQTFVVHVDDGRVMLDAAFLARQSAA
jgi:nitrite reductase (NADH) small subunit